MTEILNFKSLFFQCFTEKEICKQIHFQQCRKSFVLEPVLKLVSPWFHWTPICSAPFFGTSCQPYGQCTKKSCSEFGWRKASSKYHTSMVGFPLTASEVCLFAFKLSSGKYRSSLDYICFNQITFPYDNCPRVSWSPLQSFCKIQSLLAFDIQNTGQFYRSCAAQKIIQSMLGWCSYAALMFKVQTYKKLLFLQIVFGYIHFFYTLLLHRSLVTSSNVQLFLLWAAVDQTRFHLMSLPTQLMIPRQMLQRLCEQSLLTTEWKRRMKCQVTSTARHEALYISKRWTRRGQSDIKLSYSTSVIRWGEHGGTGDSNLALLEQVFLSGFRT